MQETKKKNTQESTEKKDRVSRGFYMVLDFMTEGLGLKGGELLTFALIYSFVSWGGEFKASRKYISDMTGLSSRSVDRAIAELLAKKYIVSVGKSELPKLNFKYVVDINRLTYELDSRGWRDSDEDEVNEERPYFGEKVRKFNYSKYKKRCPGEVLKN